LTKPPNNTRFKTHPNPIISYRLELNHRWWASDIPPRWTDCVPPEWFMTSKAELERITKIIEGESK
jgi:hypothetical protein